MALQRGHRRRSEHSEPERDEHARHEADDASKHVLALQRTAGNHAVSATLQRKVKIGEKGKWIANKRMLPAIPDSISDAYDEDVLAKIRTVADKWAGDKETAGREFESDAAFYQAVADTIAPRPTATVAQNRGRWDILKEAVETDGNVTEVPWAVFSATEGPLLEAELLKCPVQVAGSGRSTACHGNKHGKLPKAVPQVRGKPLDELDPSEQVDNTPYFEMLVAGGQKKKSGIERGIIDIDAGIVYLTAHYDVGSIAELVDVPATIVSDWTKKVTTYRKLLRGK